MITRRKLFGLVAGAVVAPKELLAAPPVATGAITLEMLQKAYAAATFSGPPPMYRFGFTGFRELPEPDFLWSKTPGFTVLRVGTADTGEEKSRC